MVIVDTSVWIDHLRIANPRLAIELNEGNVLCHPFVIGEIACGMLADREEFLQMLGELRHAPLIEHEDVLALSNHRLFGKGVGWIDAHLIAAALLSHSKLWTTDIRLHKTAAALNLSY